MKNHRHVRTLRRYWVLILVVVTAALATGVVVTALTPARYESTVSFFVKTPSSEIGGANQGDQFGQRRVSSYIQLVGSNELARRVVDDLHLEISPAEVTSRISAQADPNTVVLTATVVDGSAAESLALADAVARQLVGMVADLETPQGSTAPTVALEVITGAALDPDAVSPNLWVNTGAALLAGMAIGMLLAILLAALDSAVRSVETVEDLTGVPTLGVIPHDSSFSSTTTLIGAAR